MLDLRRTIVDRFKIDDAIKLDELLSKKDSIITIEKYFENIEKVILDERKKELFLNGVKLTFLLKDGLYRVYNKENEFIGIGLIENNLLKRDVVI